MATSPHIPMIVDPPAARSLVVIAAHPDDLERWCAGTLARASEAGATVRALLVTSGDKGSSDPRALPAVVAARRETEASRAAQLLGITDVAFLRHPDGEVEETKALRGELVRWLRTWRPQTVFTFDPEHPDPPYLSHRDHRVVGRVALDAIYPAARDPLSFPEQLREGLQPHAVGEVWLFASTVATGYVDIAPTFERKLAARLAHVSQTADPEQLRRSWQALAAQTGAPVGLSLAEAFTVLRTAP
jgi:LmbE family N-acetylglucosaminyl deacetylase